jgi:hypothetical protein
LNVGYSFMPWLCNSSFLTQSGQPIFSIVLQRHISELSSYFWSTCLRFLAKHLTSVSFLNETIQGK